MTRNKRQDIAVFVLMIITLSLCVLVMIELDSFQQFQVEDFSNQSYGSLVIREAFTPGFQEAYYEYKSEFDSRSARVNLFVLLAFVSLAFTVMIAIADRIPRSGLATKGHSYHRFKYLYNGYIVCV